MAYVPSDMPATAATKEASERLSHLLYSSNLTDTQRADLEAAIEALVVARIDQAELEAKYTAWKDRQRGYRGLDVMRLKKDVDVSWVIDADERDSLWVFWKFRTNTYLMRLNADGAFADMMYFEGNLDRKAFEKTGERKAADEFRFVASRFEGDRELVNSFAHFGVAPDQF